MSEGIKKVRMIEYDGSIESYNLLAAHLWDGNSMHVWFLDQEGSMTPIFTGIVGCAKTGMRYKPGDVYVVDVKDE